MSRVPGHGPLPANSRIMIVGEAPGADEVAVGKPFVGKSGRLLDSLLTQAGIGREGCYVTNVCKHRPPANKIEEWWTDTKSRAQKNGLVYTFGDYWLHPNVAEGLADLPHEIASAKPEVIVALGNLALWALTGETGVSNWRGSEMWYAGVPAPLGYDWNYKRKKGEPDQMRGSCRSLTSLAFTLPAVVPTYHPAYVLRVWEWKAAVTHDLRYRVAGKLGKSRKAPDYQFTIPMKLETAQEYLDRLIVMGRRQGCGDLACDVETRHGRIACVGFGWSTVDAICIPFMHVDGSRYWKPEEERALADQCRELLTDSEWMVGNQNWNYDRQYFMADPASGFRPRMDWDTMIAQHLLMPGTEKSLAYLSSLYCKHHLFWKEDGREVHTDADEMRLWRYNCVDAVKTWEVRQTQKRLLKEAGFTNG